MAYNAHEHYTKLVAKLERELSDLDAETERLKAIRIIVKRYLQANHLETRGNNHLRYLSELIADKKRSKEAVKAELEPTLRLASYDFDKRVYS